MAQNANWYMLKNRNHNLKHAEVQEQNNTQHHSLSLSIILIIILIFFCVPSTVYIIELEMKL